MALFTTYYCPRLKKNIALCNEPDIQKYIKKVKLYPIPCLFLYGGDGGVPECQYREDDNDG